MKILDTIKKTAPHFLVGAISFFDYLGLIKGILKVVYGGDSSV